MDSLAGVPHLPLRRNRNHLLLQSGQLLSATGGQTATTAYPLLVVAVWGTRSPAIRAAPGLEDLEDTMAPCTSAGI